MIFKLKNFSWLLMLGLVLLLNTSFISGDNDSARSGRKQKMLQSIAADVARYGDVLGSSKLSPNVLDAMINVPRHLFVPENLQSRAYDNNALPIGSGQTISQPTIVAVMTELLSVTFQDTVLEIGTGSGYQAAVLAEVSGFVHTIEIIPELAESASDLLADLEYSNVMVHTGDGYGGLPDFAPYKAIIVTAAPQSIPEALLEQLMPGGKLVAPVGPIGSTQWLTVWTKHDDGTITEQVIMPVRFVPLVKESAN